MSNAIIVILTLLGLGVRRFHFRELKAMVCTIQYVFPSMSYKLYPLLIEGYDKKKFKISSPSLATCDECKYHCVTSHCTTSKMVSKCTGWITHGKLTSMLPYARLWVYGATMHFRLTPTNERVVDVMLKALIVAMNLNSGQCGVFCGQVWI
jgi:hypothetical protein